MSVFGIFGILKIFWTPLNTSTVEAHYYRWIMFDLTPTPKIVFKNTSTFNINFPWLMTS